jgi:hypothetical protein
MMTDIEARGAGSGPGLAIGVGLLTAGLLLWWASRQQAFDGLEDPVLEIRVNGLSHREGRDVDLPKSGWVLQIQLPAGISPEARESLSVTLRAERTGATIEVGDQLAWQGETGRLLIERDLGLYQGLLSIKAILTDPGGATLEAHRRMRIRRWLGGPPIGSRQTLHLDFEIDRDGDGRPDFLDDLVSLGVETTADPAVQQAFAARVAEHALARVRRAYDDPSDPNGTGLPSDPVRVRFELASEPDPYVTRICVGGRNPSQPGSVGYVRFDPRNQRKRSNECDDEPVSGVFPAELSIYAESPLFREILAPFRSSDGGRPIGDEPGDRAVLAIDESAVAEGDASPRAEAIARAARVLGDALGTILAHESAHALGLVPGGRPPVGLFGGSDEASAQYAHNLDTEGRPPSTPWLMNAGGRFEFETLAGLGEAGELRFRPLSYAYLRDRVVLDER